MDYEVASFADGERSPYEIAFVVLTWNSASYIRSCITSIFSMQSITSVVCVVDNGSTDDTVRILYDFKSKIGEDRLYIFELPENQGTTIPRNLGIRSVRGKADYLCILVSDTIVHEAAIRHMMNILRTHPHIGILGPALRSPDGTIQNSGRAIPTLTVKLFKVLPVPALRRKALEMERVDDSAPLRKVGYLMSACWLMPMTTIDRVGYLDEHIFYAPEDVEYCLRTWKAGLSVCYDAEAVIVHIWQRLSRKRLFSRHNWEHIKGLAYLFWKYRYVFRRTQFDQLMKG